jgi:glycine/serine hydroxymethyltransferase
MKMRTIADEVAAAMIAERSRILGIIAAGQRFSATMSDLDEAIRGDVTAADFARNQEIESLARQISSA